MAKCETCDERFSDRIQLGEHYLNSDTCWHGVMHTIETRPAVCSYCDKPYKSVYAVNAHLAVCEENPKNRN